MKFTLSARLNQFVRSLSLQASWNFPRMQGLGFFFALLALGSVREILRDGALFGFSLFGPNFEPWVIMILPPGGFLSIGLMMGVFAWMADR